MKVVILAGGLGTRLMEETEVKPKPMVEIGGRPIMWHIMKAYAGHGFREFVVALGYKGNVIKDYFLSYHRHEANLSVNLGDGSHTPLSEAQDDWIITLVDTGLYTQTGGRLKRLKTWVGDQTFMMTYGDGVSNVDVQSLLAFHRSVGKLVTVTAVRPPARFGALSLDGDLVTGFSEKPQVGEGWINGGFFVIEPQALDTIDGDETRWEEQPMQRLVQDRQLAVFRHADFWQCMDTLRDKRLLEKLWTEGDAPWATWR